MTIEAALKQSGGSVDVHIEAEQGKRFATLQARAALAGFSLHPTDEVSEGHYVAAGWNRSYAFTDIVEIEDWLNSIAVASGGADV